LKESSKEGGTSIAPKRHSLKASKKLFQRKKVPSEKEIYQIFSGEGIEKKESNTRNNSPSQAIGTYHWSEKQRGEGKYRKRESERRCSDEPTDQPAQRWKVLHLHGKRKGTSAFQEK